MEGRTILVTGVARGIGATLAVHVRELGGRVIGLDHPLAHVNEAELDAYWPIDLANSADLEGQLRSRIGADLELHGIVNNAGITTDSLDGKGGLEQWHKVTSVNVTAPYLIVKTLAPLMPPGSAIVNISSTRTLMSEPDTEAYTASKGALRALSHSQAISLAEQRIRVNCVLPGWIDTRQDEAEPLPSASHRFHPAQRVGEPHDVARVVAFLLDPANDFITGAELVVDGGMTRKMIYE